MGSGGGSQSFVEKFSERRSHLPQNTQNSQNLLLDILPQIAEADVGGYGIPAVPTQPVTPIKTSSLALCKRGLNGLNRFVGGVTIVLNGFTCCVIIGSNGC